MQESNATGNALLDIDELPKFDQFRISDIEPGIQTTLKAAHSQVKLIETNIGQAWRENLAGLSDLSEQISRFWGPVGHMNQVKNTDELRAIYEKANSEVVSFLVQVSQNPRIYDALKQVQDGPDWMKLTPVERRLIDLKLREAALAGVGLKNEEKTRFLEIEKRLSELSTQFANKVRDATKEFGLEVTDPGRLKGLSNESLHMAAADHWKKRHAGPESAVPAMPEDAVRTGPWLFTLAAASYLPFIRNAHDRELREKMQMAYVTRASSGPHDTSALVAEILTLRREKAKLLGYADFAGLSLASKMAPDVQTVLNLLEEIRSKAWGFGKSELEELEAIAPEYGIRDGVKHWDSHFLAERLKEKRFQFTDDDIRPYFPMNRVLEGLFGIAGRLFGITVKESSNHRGLWHDDVKFYELLDEAGKTIAGFYLDPYSRPENKNGGAWMDVCRTHGLFKGKREKPVAYIVCNLTPPLTGAAGDGKPAGQALLTFGEVETLFHEFGHALHHMLSEVDLIELSGTNGVEWDAIELPSMFMENWCFYRPTLMEIGRHHQTGERIPAELVDKIIAARTFRAASMVLGQLSYGLLDFGLHTRFNPGDPVSKLHELQEEVSRRTSVMPPLPENRSLCAFSHIFAGAYAAGYYSYLWAEVLACDAFAAFEEVINDESKVAAVGRRFRRTILALGGSQHPLEIFSAFRGRRPQPDAFLKSYGLSAG